HLADGGNRGARRAERLLDTPDRLIGLILLGNNFVNFLGTAIAGIIALRVLGDPSPLVVATLLTFVFLIFAEVTPKTLAALNPERIALPSSFVLNLLMKVLYPAVWAINALSQLLMRLLGLRLDQEDQMALSREELRTVLKEAGAMLPGKHRRMLSSMLDLEQVSVEDIMVPRAEIAGIDLDGGATELRDAVMAARHTRLLLYHGSLNNLAGMLHIRKLTRLLAAGQDITAEQLLAIMDEPYFVPGGTDLYAQLKQFQQKKQRLAIIVDEYGDIIGLTTVDDVLEEIVGEFTTDPQAYDRDVHPQADGSFLIDGSANVREINRACGWELPEHGPKTLNGLIIETLEDIPEAETSFRLDDYTIEVKLVSDQAVRTARVLRHREPDEEGHD
ncbi:MAG: DUF21 domain-containing protein, partial [Gammaproteobacteria bacterium]|nr:DUF21 domain-containing protein [Gammaproteobacteria bacterium]